MGEQPGLLWGCFGSTSVFRVDRDRSFPALKGGWQCDWPLCYGSPAFEVMPAAVVTVGLMPVGVSTPADPDRLLALQSDILTAMSGWVATGDGMGWLSLPGAESRRPMPRVGASSKPRALGSLTR